MPRQSRLIPHLSEEALRLNYRQCKDSADRTRWQALWLLAQGPGAKTQREVGQLLDRSHTWVSRLVKRYNAHGPQAVPTQKRAGASRGGTPAALDGRNLAALDHALEHESPLGGGLWSGVKVTLWILQHTGVKSHRVTGWKYLCKLGYSEQIPRPSHPQAASREEQMALKNPELDCPASARTSRQSGPAELSRRSAFRFQTQLSSFVG